MESLTHTLTHTHTHTGRHTRCPYIQGQQGYGLVRQHNAVSGQWEFRESESTHGGGACGIRHLASPVVMYVSEHYPSLCVRSMHAVPPQCKNFPYAIVATILGVTHTHTHTHLLHCGGVEGPGAAVCWQHLCTYGDPEPVRAAPLQGRTQN
jgi:hypothetical protein